MVPKHLQAIVKTLSSSVQSGLNAALTPDDCKALLTLFATLQRNPPPGRKRGMFDQFAETLGEKLGERVSETITDVAADFRTVRKERKR